MKRRTREERRLRRQICRGTVFGILLFVAVGLPQWAEVVLGRAA